VCVGGEAAHVRAFTVGLACNWQILEIGRIQASGNKISAEEMPWLPIGIAFRDATRSPSKLLMPNSGFGFQEISPGISTKK